MSEKINVEKDDILDVIAENQKHESIVEDKPAFNLSNLEPQNSYEDKKIKNFEKKNLSIQNRSKEIETTAERLRQENLRMLKSIRC